MDFLANEKKWQKKWDEDGLYKFNPENIDKKFYVLEMFSYPSGANLHVGHWYNFGLTDTYARFKSMSGFEVFHPMGFDAFGLPAENYAIKTGIHPKDSTEKNIATMERQLKEMGASFDWDYEIITCNEDYYKWTQWCFLKLYENGLAYRKEAPVNWCNSCNTVLANEQVIDGECERCQSAVVKKNLTQWFFKITDYAQRLIDDLQPLDWPNKTKLMQKNWIGRSEGGEIVFDIVSGGKFSVFTTRADTLFGATYVVLAPENPLVLEITKPEYKAQVEEYIKKTSKEKEIDRLSTTREKTGVFTGAYAINPINGREIPIWIADYVLASYGTGCVMAVPAHDERDFEFAEKYNLPIERVIKSLGGSNDELPYVEYGVLCNSQYCDGLTSENAKNKIIEVLKKENRGEKKINFRLRDWLISRQRYWGAPIPIVHCEDCGEVAVPYEDLPVKLPYDVDFSPDGTSPLLKHDGFMNVACPKCGKAAKREADTMDTFVCSSWYFLRYPDNKNDVSAFDSKKINQILPVDVYVGGAEHACMHLLYARFFTKVFYDLGLINFQEPFKRLIHQGVILGTDGEKMSKSRGNVISPDEYIEKYGSDVFRMYLGFGFSYIEGGPWSDGGIKAVSRYLERVERLCQKELGTDSLPKEISTDIEFALNSAIKRISTDIEQLSFNTAIARLMEYTNTLYKYIDEYTAGLKPYVVGLIKLLAPFAPHFCEKVWQMLGNDGSIFKTAYPVCDETKLKKDTVNMALQINGKLKKNFDVDTGFTSEQIREYIESNPELNKYFDGKSIKKAIIVPGRIANFVV